MAGTSASGQGPCAKLRVCGLAAILLGLAAPALAQEHPSPESVAQSNNPLSDLTGFNINEYYAPSLYDSDAVGNVLNMQVVLIPVRRHLDIYHLVRATLPIETVPDSLTSYSSGLGDFTIQDAFKFSKAGAKTEWGIGPLLVMPTASSDALGSGKWQAGAALIVIRLLPGGSVAGGVATWQTDFAGDSERPGTNLATFQPQVALAVGTTGYYISSSPIWNFDFENDRYLIPFSLGVGRVFLVGGTIVNVALEPQVTVYHKGEQQPSMQLFFGLTLQWRRKEKALHSALADLPRRDSRSSVGPRPGPWTARSR
jgi:hypothetical protein